SRVRVLPPATQQADHRTETRGSTERGGGMTLTELAHLPGRCPHGWHLATQGCTSCGEAGKAHGQAVASAARPDDRARVDAAIRRLAATGREFSSNEARAIHGVSGPVVGAAFTAARKAGLIRAVGYTPSTEPGTHAHPVRVWVGT